MSERDEHDDAAERIVAEYNEKLIVDFSNASSDDLAGHIAADRRAAVAEKHAGVVAEIIHCNDLRTELDQERARTARLREELDIALSNLIQEDDGGHDLCVGCGEYANQHAPNCDVPGIEAALADTPSDWLATKLAEERVRCAEAVVTALGAAYIHTEHPGAYNCYRGPAEKVAADAIRSLGGEGAK